MLKEFLKNNQIYISYAYTVGFFAGIVTSYVLDIKKLFNKTLDENFTPNSIPPFVPYI